MFSQGPQGGEQVNMAEEYFRFVTETVQEVGILHKYPALSINMLYTLVVSTIVVQIYFQKHEMIVVFRLIASQ